MNFKKWVKSIKTTGYNGARTVYICEIRLCFFKDKASREFFVFVFLLCNVVFMYEVKFKTSRFFKEQNL